MKMYLFVHWFWLSSVLKIIWLVAAGNKNRSMGYISWRVRGDKRRFNCVGITREPTSWELFRLKCDQQQCANIVVESTNRKHVECFPYQLLFYWQFNIPLIKLFEKRHCLTYNPYLELVCKYLSHTIDWNLCSYCNLCTYWRQVINCAIRYLYILEIRLYFVK